MEVERKEGRGVWGGGDDCSKQGIKFSRRFPFPIAWFRLSSDLHLPLQADDVWGLQTNTAEFRRPFVVSLMFHVNWESSHTATPCRKTPWKLSRTRKANVRARLKRVDSVIEAVKESGVQCAALVRDSHVVY